jgi:hypothetical protein
MEENETLDDLEHNEDRDGGRGCCYQPLLKADPEAADRSPSRIVNVLRDLMRGGQQELRTGIASHFRAPRPRRPPAFSKVPWGFFRQEPVRRYSGRLFIGNCTARYTVHGLEEDTTQGPASGSLI